MKGKMQEDAVAGPGPAGRLALLDGYAIIHRAYHAFREPLTVRRTGEEVTAVYGFANTLLKVLEELRPTHIAVAMDKGQPFRQVQDATYKATRPEAPPSLRQQVARCRELIHAFGIPIYEVAGYEADDVLGALAQQAAELGVETYLVSLDSDIAQLVRPGVKLYMYRPYQQDVVIYDEEGVRARYGVEPRQIPDVKALRGDASDNIPGVPGIGEKTAVRLIQQFGSVEALYEHLDAVAPPKLAQSLQQYRDQVLRAKEQATIVTDVPVRLDLETCRIDRYDRDRVVTLFRELEFRSLLRRLPELPVGAELPRRDSQKQVSLRYHVVRNKTDLEALVARLRQAGGFAFDTETTGANPFLARPVGFSFSPEAGEAYYVPVGHAGDEQLSLDEALGQLRPLLEDTAIPKTAHNAKFDVVVLALAGIWPQRVEFDTMIAAWLLGAGALTSEAAALEGGRMRSQSSLSLKALVFDRLGIEMTPITDLIGKGAKQLSFDQVPVEAAAQYACADADMAGRLRPVLEQELHQDERMWRLFTEVEMPLMPVLARMEMAGIALDVGVLREMSIELGEELKRIEREIYAHVGHEFNIGSPQQLSKVLFEELRLPRGRRTKYGYTTDAQTLEALRGHHPVVELILEHRQVAKIKSTYVDALPAMINPRTGRVHTTFNQTVAATGRLSSADPNLQNIPVRTELGRRVRRAFVAREPGPDPIFLAADYSQIELRILAHYSKDPSLIEAFQRDEDIHRTTAAQVLGIPAEQVTPDQRRLAKMVNYAVIYGLSEYGLASRTELSQQEARDFIDAYFRRYPKVKEYIDRTIAETRRLGYAETLLGRRRYIPEINSPNYQVRAAAERVAINMPIQGTNADIIKIAMIRIQDELDRRKFKSRMILQVHDELIFEGPRAEQDDLKELVLRIMPSPIELVVPLKVDVKTGTSWGDLE